MKPDFEKMALDFADEDPDGTIDITQAGMVDVLREAYAAGYRDGQARMQERCSEVMVMPLFDPDESEEYNHGFANGVGDHMRAVHVLPTEEPPT